MELVVERQWNVGCARFHVAPVANDEADSHPNHKVA